MGCLAAIVLLAVALAGLQVARQDRASSSARVAGEELQQLEAFVSGVRHLDFTRPVSVTLLSSAEYDRTRAGGSELLRSYLVSLFPLMKPLGLSTGPSDPTELSQEALKYEFGYYENDAIVVRGESITPFVRRVIVHELTHALDDQHFDLAEVRRFSGPSNALSIEALIEGDARRVDAAYVATLSDADRIQATHPDVGPANPADALPEEMQTLLDFPYTAGAPFVAALAEHGGEAAVDEAFGQPPLRSREVLHPEVYLDLAQREQLTRAALALGSPSPPPGGAATATDPPRHLGELMIRLVLSKTLGAVAAGRAAEDWNGDVAISWYDGSQPCVLIDFAPPADSSSTLLAQALTTRSQQHPGSTFEDGRLIACA
jgi:hypothetical protein